MFAGVEGIEGATGSENARDVGGKLREGVVGEMVQQEDCEHHVEWAMMAASAVPSMKVAFGMPRRRASAFACWMAAGDRSTPVSCATCGASSNSVSPIPQPMLNTREVFPAPVSLNIRWTMFCRSARTAGRAKCDCAKPE